MYSFYESSRSKKFGRTSANMYLQFKWDMENYATHRYNVKTAKPSIDNSAPRTFTHMFIRPKKLQFELERYSSIQRNNRFLLERLATIYREGAWIDNKNYHEIKSLNTWKRQQEMISLAYNNQIMLARLHDVGAGLNRHKLEDEYLMNQKYKANILKFPPNWREIQQHLVHLKKETFKKVFDSKYQRREYEKSRKKVLKRWATEREKHEAAKAERLSKPSVPNEKQEAVIKKEDGDAAKGQKKTSEGGQKKSSKLETGKEEKLKFDKEKQKTDTRKKTSIKGKEETRKKVPLYQRKKPHSETARSSTTKTNIVKKEIRSKQPIKQPIKAPAGSTGFHFKGDGKSIKDKISDEDKQKGSKENTQDSKIVPEEKNESFHLDRNKSGGSIENIDFPTPSETSKESESENDVLTPISDKKQSEVSNESRNEKDTKDNRYTAASQDKDKASDSFGGEYSTDEKTDHETENSESSGTSVIDKNSDSENGNKIFPVESSYETSEEASDSKEDDNDH